MVRDLWQLELDLASLPTMGAEGVFAEVFQAMAGDPDFEYVIVDGTRVPVHQHGIGGKGDAESGYWSFPRRPDHQDLGLVDALANLARFTLWSGQRHDSVLADKAFDIDALRFNSISAALWPSFRRRPAAGAISNTIS